MLSFSISYPKFNKNFITLQILPKEGIGSKSRGDTVGGETEGDFMDKSNTRNKVSSSEDY
jgi:hypothetical protein